MKLAAPENLFRTIVEEATAFAMVLLDERGHITMWNAGARVLFGYAADEVVGRHFELIFFEADRQAGIPEKELDHARATGFADDTRWHRAKGERPIFVDGVTTALRDHDGTLVG